MPSGLSKQRKPSRLSSTVKKLDNSAFFREMRGSLAHSLRIDSLFFFEWKVLSDLLRNSYFQTRDGKLATDAP